MISGRIIWVVVENIPQGEIGEYRHPVCAFEDEREALAYCVETWDKAKTEGKELSYSPVGIPLKARD